VTDPSAASSWVVSVPASVEDDVRRARRLIEQVVAAMRPLATVHHPECRALATGDLADCGCGGVAFPV
jgi:hypothetical protein